MFPQLHVLLPIKQEVSDLPADRVGHAQLGERVLQKTRDESIEGGTEIHKQDPSIGSWRVQVLEDEPAMLTVPSADLLAL